MNNEKERQKQLEEKMINFAVNVIALSKTLPKTTENKITSAQLIRSATSIGANYTEANNASSRVDFRSKIFIAKKEAAETRYWLQILTKTNDNLDTAALIDEFLSCYLFSRKSYRH